MKRAMSAGNVSGSSGARAARVRRLLLALIALLYVVSIPWYRRPDSEPALILGLPDWVLVALGCYIGVAVLNAAAWLLTDLDDPVPRGGGRPR
jgi:hypothetical protein